MSDFFAESDWLDFSNVVDQETEFIPLISPEEEDRMNTEEVPEKLSILPLRNNVLFPGVVMPITVGRDKSIKLINSFSFSSISFFPESIKKFGIKTISISTGALVVCDPIFFQSETI